MRQPQTPAVVPAHEVDDSSGRFLEEVRRRVGPRNFENWFERQTAVCVSAERLTLRVGNPFLLVWMQKRFRPALAEAARTALGPAAIVHFEVDARLALDEKPAACGKAPREAGKKPPAPPSRARPPASPRPAGENRRFCDLDEFIAGECNDFALSAARRVVQKPGRVNPVFIHGGVGTGKTHLLEGVYRALRSASPALNVMFLPAESFANHFTRGLRENSLPVFRQRMRSVDALLVDDVDFLENKPVIQEEFLHTFEELYSRGRQIVLTADRHPRLLSKTCEELTTRFAAGMLCRVEPPDALTRRKFVSAMSERLKMAIAAEALDYVARRFDRSIRELQGAMHTLATWQEMTGRRVTAGAARRVLVELERDCVRILRITDVEKSVCDLFGVEADDLRSPRRARILSRPRMLAMFLIRKHLGASYSEIGRHFGGRNHATVMSAEKKVRAWLACDETIRVSSQSLPISEVIETLEEHLRAG